MAKSKKSFDINSLTDDQVIALSVAVGERVRVICDKAVDQANKLLNKYGMECKMAFQLGKLGTFPEKPTLYQKKSNLIDKEQI